MSREEQVEAALIAHEPLTDYDGEIDACGCGEWYGPNTWQQHVANSADFRAILAHERAAALREAADDFLDYADRIDLISATRAAHWRDGAHRLRGRADEVTR